MKVALLISGYLRSIKLNSLNIKKLILNKFDKVDVYIHITENETIDDKYLNLNENEENIKFIKNEFNPKALLIESNIEFSKNKKENDLLNSWFKLYKLNQIKKYNESITGKYDIVIKTRPDVNLVNLKFKKNLNYIHIPNKSLVDKNKLSNLDDPYLCDIFAYSSSEMMDKYFDIYQDIFKLINKYGKTPETILYYYLNDNKIKYELENIDFNVILSQCNVFAICGDSGSGKTTLGNLLKKYFSNSILFECDRYHKWERNSKNWKKYTHLNPEANYISKMQNDVFNLKIKNSIFQVDYDHNTGKFKEPEKIENADNVIVCGLHSLYGDNKHVFNFSIFMDPDESLKRKWKIERDTKNRGYTKDKVLKQISDRKNDYKKYILPQKNKSDVIVNFFEKNSSVGLNIYINKKYSLELIISILSKYNIPYQLKIEKNFNVITFNEYVYCELWNFGIPNEEYLKFYNYIFYIILNLKTNY